MQEVSGESRAREDIFKQLKYVEDELKKVIPSVKSHLALDIVKPQSTPIADGDIHALISELAALIKDNNTEAREKTVILQRMLIDNDYKNALEILLGAIDNYDFDSASASLGQIAMQLKKAA